MTDLEIKEEAKRRYAALSEEEKYTVWCPDISQEDLAFVKYVEKVGSSQLSEEEENRFLVLTLHAHNSTLPGGMIEYGIAKDIEERYNISREDLANGAKNPYGREIRILLLGGLGMALVGALIAVIGAKADVGWLRVAGIAVSTVGGLLALRFASVVSAYFDFRRIQKKYKSGEMDEELIKCEMASLVVEEKKKLWFREENA